MISILVLTLASAEAEAKFQVILRVIGQYQPFNNDEEKSSMMINYYSNALLFINGVVFNQF